MSLADAGLPLVDAGLQRVALADIKKPWVNPTWEKIVLEVLIYRFVLHGIPPTPVRVALESATSGTLTLEGIPSRSLESDAEKTQALRVLQLASTLENHLPTMRIRNVNSKLWAFSGV